MEGEIYTYSGRRVNVLDLQVSDINIIDIASSLSKLCRYTGHGKYFYSVAEHSVRVASLCCYPDRLHALLHDASEAYLGDVAGPIKHSIIYEQYRALEEKVMNVISQAFALGDVWQEPELVRHYDKVIRGSEMRTLFNREIKSGELDIKIWPWPHETAKELYLQWFSYYAIERMKSSLAVKWQGD